MAKKKIINPEEALLLGLGVASMAKDRFESFMDFLIKEGKLAAKDRKKIKKDFLSKGEKEYKMMAKMYEQSLSKALKAMGVPTRKEFEALKKQVGAKAKSSKKRAKKK